MSYIVAALPGFQLSLGIFVLVFAMAQFYINHRRGSKRALYSGLFCAGSAIICFFQFVLQSHLFSTNFTGLFVLYIMFHVGLTRYLYVKSLNYFIAISNRVLKTYLFSNGILWFFACVPLISHLYGGPDLFFDTQNLVPVDNYFMNSISGRLGKPVVYSMAILSLFSLGDLIMAIYLFERVRRSTGDKWFMAGMLATAFAAITECFLLPITQAYYVPVYFLSNFFEAGRMSFLSTREYIIAVYGVAGEHGKGQIDEIENNPIDDKMVEELTDKLKYLLEHKLIYQRPKLSLDELARELRVPSYVVSQVLNHGMGTSFFELLNSYRISAVKKDLENPELKERTIIDIAYMQGFSSKSSFNSSFKRLTGETPSSYRKKFVKN